MGCRSSYSRIAIFIFIQTTSTDSNLMERKAGAASINMISRKNFRIRTEKPDLIKPYRSRKSTWKIRCVVLSDNLGQCIYRSKQRVKQTLAPCLVNFSRP